MPRIDDPQSDPQAPETPQTTSHAPQRPAVMTRPKADLAAARAVRRALRGTPPPTTEPQTTYTPLGYVEDPLQNPARKAERLLKGDRLTQSGLKLGMTDDEVVALGLGVLQHRASLIHAGLVQDHPEAAAAALVSDVPTIDLKSHTAVLHQGITWLQARTMMAGVPGGLLPFYHQAFLLNDPDQRALYLELLDHVGSLSEEDQQAALPQLDAMSTAVANGWKLTPNQSDLSAVSHAVGETFAAPFVAAGWALSTTAKAYGAAASHIPFLGEDTAATIDAARRGVGSAAAQAGTGATFLLRNLIEAPVGLAATTLDMAGRAITGKDTSGFDIADYVTTWDEVSHGDHGPIAATAADVLGVEVTDAKYQGLFDALDVTGDIAASILLGKAGAAYKSYLTDTVANGGTQLGSGWAESFFGKRTVSAVSETLADAIENQKPIRAALLDRFPNMKAAMADELARTLPEDVPRVIADYIDRVPTRELPATSAELQDVRESLSTETDPVAIEELRAQEASLEQRVSDLQQSLREPAFEFPKRSRISSWMRAADLSDTSWASRMLRNTFGETGVFDLSRWTDDIAPKERVLYDRTSGNTPPGGVEQTVETLRKTMNIAKVDKPLQRAVIEEYLAYEGKHGFFNATKSYFDALEEGITRGGSRELTPEASRILRFSDRSYEERLGSPIEIEHTLPDGTVVTTTENVVQMPDGTPMPSRPAQFIGDRIMMPDPELLRQTSSFTRYYTRNVPKMPLDIARFVALTLPRMVLRPGILVLRIIPMGIKIQLDQMIREIASGYRPLKGWTTRGYDFTEAGVPIKAGIRDLLPDQDITLIGSVDHELESLQGEAVVSRMSTRNIFDTASDRRATLVGKGLVDKIQQLAADELTKKVALWGPEGTLQYLTDHPDSRLARIYDRDIKPTLEEAGMTPEEWLARTDLEITQATGGNAELRTAIATGRWDVGSKLPTGEAIELELQRAELVDARAQSLEATNPVEQRVASLRVEEVERRIAHLESRAQTTGTLSIKNHEQMVNQVLNAAREDRFKLPKEVTVKQRAMPWRGDRSLGERAQLAARNLNRTIYKGLKPLGMADLHLTRGSTYFQALRETYDNLVAKGYKPAEAFEISQYHAAYIAKDLHYDISARSTMDRQFKDIFWFAPVLRENLLTYLVKLPSKAFWPAGIVAEFGGAHALLTGLKELGILSDHTFFNSDTEQNETELVLNIPWVTDFISNITGGDPNVGGMRVGGLNPAVAGQGLLPTVAPGIEAIFDGTAKAMPESVRPLFDFLADRFEFDQDVEHIGYGAFVPSALRYGLELLGIHLPLDDLSGSAIADANRKASVQSIRWAASKLAKDGVKPPGADATDAEVASYRAKLAAEAGHYRTTLTAIHLIGQLVFPGSFTTPAGGVTRAGTNYYKARDGWEADYKYGTKEYFAAQDGYLRTHPGAWPYSVGTHDTPDGYKYDPATYDDLPTLNPDDYVDKALGSTHYWMDDAPTDAEGNPVEPDTKEQFDSLSPRQLLRRAAEAAASDLTTLNAGQLHALNVPDFEGRNHLLTTIAQINKEFENRYSYDDSDAQKKALINQRDEALQRAANHYGADGKAVLALTDWGSTPAERLDAGGYLESDSAQQVLAEAATVWRKAVAQGYNPDYSSAYVDGLKAGLVQHITQLRREDPEFDREIRRISLGVTDKTGALMNTEAYLRLFFGTAAGESTIGAS